MERVLKPSMYVPFDPNVPVYTQSEGQVFIPAQHCGLHPFQYANEWDEMMASHKGCYINATLNPVATNYTKGPDALKLYRDACVNTFENFSVGKGKHGVMCNENGMIVKDGMLIRLSEDEFMGFWMYPYIGYLAEKGNYDLTDVDVTGRVFMYQLAGPTCLDLVEKTTGESFADLKFSNFRLAQIAGRGVLVLRMGMAGSLAYEIHGRIEDADAVYEELLRVGQDYGIQPIGRRTYINVHTEGGFPQQGIHYTSALSDPGYVAWMKEKGCWGGYPINPTGSMGPDVSLRWVTPVDVGWGRLIKFDHDFPGREALQKALEHPTKTPVTLVWEPEDLLDIWASMFQDGEPYMPLGFWDDFSHRIANSDLHADQVLVGNKLIGLSSGRMYSPAYRAMITLGFIDPAYSALGTQVEILWGNPGTRQKRVRATVSRYPFEDNGGHAPEEKKA